VGSNPAAPIDGILEKSGIPLFLGYIAAFGHSQLGVTQYVKLRHPPRSPQNQSGTQTSSVATNDYIEFFHVSIFSLSKYYQSSIAP
jgi:hypothetical protein